MHEERSSSFFVRKFVSSFDGQTEATKWARGHRILQNLSDEVPVPRGHAGRVFVSFALSYAVVTGTLIKASLVSGYANRQNGTLNIKKTSFPRKRIPKWHRTPPDAARAMESLEDLDSALGRGAAEARVIRGSSTQGIFAVWPSTDRTSLSRRHRFGTRGNNFFTITAWHARNTSLFIIYWRKYGDKSQATLQKRRLLAWIHTRKKCSIKLLNGCL